MDKAVMKKRIGVLTVVFIIAVGAAFAYCLFTAKTGRGFPCVINIITGLKCPGCGNSRAALALVHFDIKSALRYNLLFPLEFGYIAVILFFSSRQYLKTGKFNYNLPHKWIDVSVLAIILIWFVARNIIGI